MIVSIVFVNMLTLELSMILYIYLQCRIYGITINVGNCNDDILTATDFILFKCSALFTHASIDVMAVSITLIYIIIYMDMKYLNNISDAIFKSTAYMKYTCVTYISLMYITHKSAIYNHIECTQIYPLHNNYISAIHPPILLIGIILASIINNILLLTQYDKTEKAAK